MALGAVAALALAGAGTAHADITGTVLTPAGVPVGDQSVQVVDANGRTATSDRTDPNGVFAIPTSTLEGDTPPFTLTASTYDSCRSFSENRQREVQAGNVADGLPGAPTVVPLVLDLLDLCAGTAGSGAPATGLVDAPGRRVITPPGGTVYLEVLAPYGAQNLLITLQDGTPVGSSASDRTILVTAPAAGYEGPMNLSYVVDTVPVTRNLGTLVARPLTAPVPLPGPIDIEAIVDVSGSMGGNDPNSLRKDAVSLLIDLARPADRLGAVGFDNEFKPIFDSTVITGQADVANRLKAMARKRIGDFGGTDYNVGLDEAYKALTGPGLDPQRQKGVIFLTDGAHGGTYNNGHLRFAYNPSGRPWPICAVQLGAPSSFQPEDVARLKRIAAETGGQYLATSDAGKLTELYFRCFGRSTGQRTLLTKNFSYRAGQQRVFTQKLPPRLPSATFFVGWGNGRYGLQLIDPRKRVHTAAKPGKGFVYRGGAAFGFFRVTKPIAGTWRLQVVARRLTVPRDQARTTITAAPRR
jgi:hypothetical protein